LLTKYPVKPVSVIKPKSVQKHLTIHLFVMIGSWCIWMCVSW